MINSLFADLLLTTSNEGRVSEAAAARSDGETCAGSDLLISQHVFEPFTIVVTVIMT